MFDWEIFKYEEGNLSEMISITKQNYGEIEISDEKFLQWQYFKNPVGDALIKLAKSENNEIVGQYIIIPMKIKVDKEIIKGTLSLNTLTRKDYRGKGIFTGLAESAYKQCKEDGLDFTYGFPNQNSYLGFVKKLRFSDLGSIPLMLYPLNIENLILKKFNSRFLAALAKPFKCMFNFELKDYNDIKIEQIYDNEIFDTFWQEVKDKYRIIGVRDSKYINWRYRDVPDREYNIIGAYKEDKLVAYSVLRYSEILNFKCGMIVDFIVKEGEILAGIQLLKEAILKFKNNGMELVGCLMRENAEEYKILKKSKFIKCPKFLEPQPFKIIYRNHLNDKRKELEDIDNWFLTMGDYDVI